MLCFLCFCLLSLLPPQLEVSILVLFRPAPGSAESVLTHAAFNEVPPVSRFVDSLEFGNAGLRIEGGVLDGKAFEVAVHPAAGNSGPDHA